MADTVNVQVIADDIRNYVVKLSCKSDGTGESAVTKVDISTLAGPVPGVAPDSLALREVQYDIQGFTSIELFYDADTDDELLKISGNGYMFWGHQGNVQDPESTGATGDIKLTSNGAVNGATYDMTLHFIKKQ